MSKQVPPAEMDVWILAGQSNMQGVGELTGVSQPSDKVWNFSSAGEWNVAEEPLHRFWESFTPINQKLMRVNMPPEHQVLSDAELEAMEEKPWKFGAGLGMSFGQSMVARTARPVGLIAAAHGGTSMAQWGVDKKAMGGHSLYGALLERVARSGRKPKGMLWYQGESDSGTTETSEGYGKTLSHWIATVRADVGVADLPVLIVQIGRTTSDTINVRGWNEVQQQQYDLVTHVPNTAVTSAIDLPLVDCIHINTPGLKRLGVRLAGMAAMLTAGTHGTQIGPRLKSVKQSNDFPDRADVDLTFTGVTRAWLPADNIAGFEVLDTTGRPHKTNHVINASRHPTDPTCIRVRIDELLKPGEKLAYGHGILPYCNAVDEGDFPMCAMSMGVDTK